MKYTKIPTDIRKKVNYKELENRKIKLISTIIGSTLITGLSIISIDLSFNLEEIKNQQNQTFLRIIEEI